MNSNQTTPTLLVCTHYRTNATLPSCARRGSEAILSALHNAVDLAGLSICVEGITCLGYCGEGPNVRLVAGQFWHEVTLEQVEEIVANVKNK